jgi:hypothetical protein
MKAILFMIIMISSSTYAQNSEVSYSRDYDDFKVEYLAWCDQNNVVTQDSKGQTKITANCSENNTVCRTYHIHRHFGAIVTAGCEKPQ